MGSKSSSSTSSTNTTQDFTTNNVDNRVSDGDIGGNINLTLSDISTAGSGVFAAGGGGVNTTITTSDFGALDAASELSDRAFAFAEKTASSAAMSNTAALKSAFGVAKSAAQDEGARTRQLLIISGVVVAVSFIFLRRKK